MTQAGDTSGITVESLRIEARDKRDKLVQLEPAALEHLGTPYHLAMYFTLARLADSENSTAPNLDALAWKACMSRRKAMQVLNELEERGVIARTRTRLDNGLTGRTVYSVLGIDTSTGHTMPPRGHEMPTRHTVPPAGHEMPSTISSGNLREASHAPHVVVAITNKTTTLVEGLRTAGVSLHVAEQLVRDMPEECGRQLAALAHRPGVRDQAATLVAAIRDGWELPDSVARAERAAKRAELTAQQQHLREQCQRCHGDGFIESSEQPGAMAYCPDCMVRSES